MSSQRQVGLRTLVLAIHEEAAITAAAKGLTGTLAQLATLQETASLVSGQVGRAVSEEEVMRIVLNARRARRLRAEAGDDSTKAVETRSAETRTTETRSGEPAPVRLKRRRLAPLAVRSLTRHIAATLR